MIRRWFEEQRDIELLEWPSKSPDLNPIENVWGNIVNMWEAGRERNSEQLFQHTRSEWERCRRIPNVIYNTIASMPQRLQDVIDNGGGWTSY